MDDHTPGEWRANGKYIEAPMGLGIARIAIVDDGAGITDPKANARLIAAAPDLLECLEHITDYIDREGPAAKEWKAITEWCERGQAAIARAKGA